MDPDLESDDPHVYSDGDAEGSVSVEAVPDKHNSDWDSRLELLRVCSSNGKFLTKKARAPPIGGKWASEEDEHLRDIVRVHGAENWRKVAALLGPTRTDVQCLHRWNKVLRPGLQKGAWSVDEDRLVRDAVQYQALNGVGRILWSEIAAQLPGRLGKQCRERYFNHLDPSINKGDWTPPEDRILFEGQKQFGNRWCEISKVLPGRTENSVKNRWNSSAMRRWLKENNLSAGSGAPLHDIAAIEDLHRALAAFSDSLALCGISISKETAATLLSDMTSISVDDSAAGKEKAKKEKLKKKKSAAEVALEAEDEKEKENGISGVKGASGVISRTSSSDVVLLEVKREPSAEKALNGNSRDLQRVNSSGSTGTNGHSRNNSIGMILPSHLRPPLIVTGGAPQGHSVSRTSSGSATGTSEDHELLELLSNMKSSPKWDLGPPAPFSSERKRTQDQNTMQQQGDSSDKRIKMEGVPARRNSTDASTPTDRALKRVRSELAKREAESRRKAEEGDDDLTRDYSAADHHDDGVVPFDLLPFFKYLGDNTQSCLMQQLVDHFQQTSYTPRNFNALLPTPRNPNDTGSSGGAYAYGYNGITHTLTLCSPRGELSHSNRPPTNYSFDPKCFEKDFVTAHIAKTEAQGGREQSSIGDDAGMRSDALQSYLNAPINAAVNVALKCATREASFEEVLSWLGEAPDPYAESPMKGRAPASVEAPAASLEMPPPVNRRESPGGGMVLPSHLRPPLILTEGGSLDQSLSRPPSGSATGSSTTSSEDHKMVVELLSNLKTSPKWAHDLVPPPSTAIGGGGSPQRRLTGRAKRRTFHEANTPMNGAGDESGHCHRALKRVRLELAMREMEGREKKEGGNDSGKGAVEVEVDNSIVPFQLLPFFQYLDDHAQRCLMRQLVDHFQQTSYTPRNFNALLPTPRYSHRPNLSAGGGALSDFIDPNCFEEGALTCTSFSEDSVASGEHPRKRSFTIKEANGIATIRSRSGSREEDSITNMDSCSSDDVQAYLDAPINAAVNVALKCATREASFEEVLSWLIGASSHQSGFEYSPPPEREGREGCNSFYPTEVMMLSTAYNIL